MAYSDDVEFFFIYVSEAHPEQLGQRGFKAKTVEERVQFACKTRDTNATVEGFAVPVLVDEPDLRMQLAYVGYPARTVLVGREGRVVWASAAGPRGIMRPVRNGQAEAALKVELAKAPPTEAALLAVAREQTAWDTSFYRAPEGAAEPVALINCGASADYTDKSGRVWRKDQPYRPGAAGRVGGTAIVSQPHWVVGTRDWPIYAVAVEGMDGYIVPVPDGRYVVRLHFAEINKAGQQRRRGPTSPGQPRTFDVALEGRTVLEGFNTLGVTAGRKYAAVAKDLLVSVGDGELTVEFRPRASAAPPAINAIEVWRAAAQ